MGDPLDVCVPSGNFGNILGAYYAKLMGLPVGRLICASNTNNVLTDFFSTGVYDISDRESREDRLAVDGHPHLVQSGAAAVRGAPGRRAGARLDEGSR